jgi:hypothetical protein
MDGHMAPPLPYELRIGVSGHRVLADEAAVSRTVGHLLDKIEQTLNRPSTPVAWTVVSPLARGADRIVAAELGHADESTEDSVHVPIPAGNRAGACSSADGCRQSPTRRRRSTRVPVAVCAAGKP